MKKLILAVLFLMIGLLLLPFKCLATPTVGLYTSTDSAGATVASIDLAKPANVDVGDLLLIIAGNDNTDTAVFETITGWTRFVSENSIDADAELACYWRIATNDAEENTVTVSISSPNIREMWGWYIRVSGVDTDTPINALGTVSFTSLDTTHVITEVTSGVDYCLCIYAFSFDGGDGCPFSVAGTEWTETAEQQSGTGGFDASGCWGTKEQATAGGAGTATVTSTYQDGATGIQFAIAPAAAPPAASAPPVQMRTGVTLRSGITIRP